MALSIKDPETEALARKLAAKTGETITQAVKIAVMERLRSQRTEAEIQAEVEEMMKIARRVASLPDRPGTVGLTPDEIVGHNEFGGFDPW